MTLLHAGLNIWERVVALHPTETGEVLSAYALTAGWGIVATGLVLLFGGETLTRTGYLPTLSVGENE